MGDNEEWPEADWSGIDPDDMRALEESATMEKRVFSDDRTPIQLAQKILDDASVAAAQSIVNIATKDPNSSTRLRAATYLIDRTLGKVGADRTQANPWDDLFSEVATEVKNNPSR